MPILAVAKCASRVLKLRACSQLRLSALFVSILLLPSFAHSANVLLIRPANANSLEQRQLEIATEFYGVGLTIIDANTNGFGAALDREVLQKETVAVAIEANALGLVDQQNLLRRLHRRTEPVPLVVLGVTSDTDPVALQGWSAGVLTAGKRVTGKLQYHVASVPELALQLAAVEFPFPADNAFYLAVSEKGKAQVIMGVGDSTDIFPTFVEADVRQQRVFLLSRTFPEDDAQLAVNAGDTVGAFARLAPLMLVVRYCAGKQGWHAAHHYANLTIDDPWLREPYGYLDYKALLEEMEKHKFHTTIAFIPWNYDRSEPDVVSLFRSHPDRFSICVHGNNHDHDEFTEPHPDKVADIQQSLARMEKFQRMTNIPYDRVMVFPHNIGSEDLLKELKTYNFVATVNSSNVPSDRVKPTDILSALRPVTLAYGDFPSVNRYSADMAHPNAFIAINDFLENSLFFYSHHGLFASGSNAFDGVADLVNRLEPDTRWRNLGEIARHLYIVKQRTDLNYDVTAFSSTFELENMSGRDATFYVSKHEDSSSSAVSVTVDGRPIPFDVRDGEMHLRIAVADGGARQVQISYSNDLDLASIGTSRGPIREYSLRMVSDFRDIRLSGLPFGKAISDFYYRHQLSPASMILPIGTLAMICAYGVWRRVLSRRARGTLRSGHMPLQATRKL